MRNWESYYGFAICHAMWMARALTSPWQLDEVSMCFSLHKIGMYGNYDWELSWWFYIYHFLGCDINFIFRLERKKLATLYLFNPDAKYWRQSECLLEIKTWIPTCHQLCKQVSTEFPFPSQFSRIKKKSRLF